MAKLPLTPPSPQWGEEEGEGIPLILFFVLFRNDQK